MRKRDGGKKVTNMIGHAVCRGENIPKQIIISLKCELVTYLPPSLFSHLMNVPLYPDKVGVEPSYKVRLIEEEFKRLMFDERGM